MVKRLFLTLVAASVLVSVAHAQQALQDACLMDVADSVAAAFGMSDSVTVVGDCDSAVALTTGAFPLPIASLVRQDSCNVAVTYLLVMDTVYNFCTLGAGYDPTSAVRSGVSVAVSGRRVALSGSALPAGDIVVRLIDGNGRCVEVLKRAGASWIIARSRGSLICAVEADGRTVAARRIMVAW